MGSLVRVMGGKVNNGQQVQTYSTIKNTAYIHEDSRGENMFIIRRA